MPDVSYPVGDGSGQGYLAVPAAGTTAPTLQVSHDIKVYPGAGHHFMTEPKHPALAPLANFARMGYNEAAAEDSWHRIFAFFAENLRS
jgi:dienelactone hydrolase